MRVRCLGKRVALVDLNLDLAAADQVEHLRSRLLEPLARHHVRGKRRAREEQRSLGGEDAEIHAGHRAGCVAETHHQATRLQAVERAFPRVLADTVVHHRHFCALGDLLHALDEIFLAVVDRLPRAVFFRQRRLFRRRHGADHLHAKRFRPLARDQSHPARRRVHQDRFVALQPIGLAKKILDGQTLEHHCSGLFEGDLRRQAHHRCCRHHTQIGVRTYRALRIRNAIALFEEFDVAAHRFHHPGRLGADAVRQRQRIKADAVINVDVIEPDRVLADTHLFRPRIADFEFDQLEFLRPAVLLHLDRFCLHLVLSLDRAKTTFTQRPNRRACATEPTACTYQRRAAETARPTPSSKRTYRKALPDGHLPRSITGLPAVQTRACLCSAPVRIRRLGAPGAAVVRIHTVFLFCLACVAWLASALGSVDAFAAPAAAGPLSPCRITGLSQEIRCGEVEVPETPDTTTGRRLKIQFAVVPALAKNKAPDPVFVLAGGPGQPAMQIAPLAMPLLAQINTRRDIVFIDQRGTGKSNPLVCATDEKKPRLADSFDLQRQIERMGACLRSLDADPRQYATWIAVRDLDAVRALLGAGQVNLWGASYGTRVGLEYLRQFPDRVRTAVLDGVAPPDMRLPASFAVDGQAALDRMIAACTQDAACNARYP